MCAQIIQKMCPDEPLVACHGFLGKARGCDIGIKPMSIDATQHQESVVGLGGLEPPASPLSGARSNHLSYRPNVSSPDGGACRDRTDDPLLAKQVLSQLS